MQQELYRGREQTLVKHTLLRNYLAGFGHVIGQTYGSVTYVDCFSGPWMASSEELEDTSFFIALEELKKARSTLLEMGRSLRIRCFFIESDSDAYSRLEEFAEKAREPGIEIETRRKRFEETIPEIIEFTKRDSTSFPFIFIDPTGWKSVAIQTIRPLLEIQPGEVLVNLMTSYLHRFAKQTKLFSKERLQGLSGIDLDDEMVAQYSEALAKYGGYNYVVAAIILRAEIDTPQYRLVYATRHPRGVEKFKHAERQAMQDMQVARAIAKQRRREARTHQVELFSGEVVENQRFYLDLHQRYLTKSSDATLKLLKTRKRISYDELWACAISKPLVFESDLKRWLRDWSAHVSVEGLGPNERTPKRDHNHFVVWH